MGEEDQNELLWFGEGREGGRSAAELPPWAAGAVLMGLREHSVAFRLETDLPRFVWVHVQHETDRIPRVLADHLLDGASVVSQTTAAAHASDRGQFLVPDWYERGVAETLEKAVSALANAVAHRFPEGSFATWWPRFLSEINAEAT